MSQSSAVFATLQALREQAPTVQIVAGPADLELALQLLTTVGAVPLVSHDETAIAHGGPGEEGLVIDPGVVGLLGPDSLIRAARGAVENGRNWILNPARLRLGEPARGLSMRLSRLQPTIIRGGGAAIVDLYRYDDRSNDGDHPVPSEEALDAASDLARETGAVVAVTGSVDYVTTGRTTQAVGNGEEMMGRIWGIGCALSALICACCSVAGSPAAAALHGLTLLSVAGELAAAEATGPASYRQGLLDRLAGLDAATLAEKASIG